MEFQGGSIEGGGYGDLSPKDYPGLQAWYRATDGVEFSRGTVVRRWKDISGNDRHLLNASNAGAELAGSSGNIINTAYGLAYTQVNQTSGMSPVNSGTWHNFLYNGSPYTILIVMRSVVSNSNFIFNTTTNLGGAGTIGSTSTFSTGNMSLRPNNHSSLDNFGNIAVNKNYVYNLTSYGYNNGITPATVFSINNSPKISGNFTSSPVGVTARGTLYLSCINVPIYEVIIYNQTGKSQTLINFELNNLFEIYIKNRYKNFIA
jgi:hypothetical protein